MKGFFKRTGKQNSGAALLEFVLCFPILFVLFLFIVQFSQILLSWQVLHYAAYMGARSTMTCNTSERDEIAKDAVLRILAVVSNSPTSSKDSGNSYGKLDGWGNLPHTKYLEKQTDVSIDEDSGNDTVKCTVKFKMFLMVPVAGKIISYFAEDADDDWEQEIKEQGVALNPALLATHSNEMDLDGTDIPYMEIESVSAVSIPYDTKHYPKQK